MVEISHDDVLRIRLQNARPWRAQPGQYIYLTLPRIALGTSHPFSVAWTETQPSPAINLLVRRRSGFTKKLFDATASMPERKFTTAALIEGPYGRENLSSYGTVILFAAGIGITYHMQQILHLVRSHMDCTAAVRRITLVWAMRSVQDFEWARQWLVEVVENHGPQNRILSTLLFITKPGTGLGRPFDGYPAQVYLGRPNFKVLLEQLMQKDGGAAAVSVCGPGGFADDVCKAVRSLHPVWNVDLFVQGGLY
ncbi:FAD-binding 8 [Macrophomina phaseolina MS6]|uniref:ferric-chelate reductase (NADPH) n=1 Tax=Macrophomina phaseolina (strain MS6) TaxID=1126212 RepID=K2RXU7_MACPH|nr:FAD-binding 8 [Macrophomina phaseolina MS6]